MARDSDRWRSAAKAAMNIGARINARKLLTGRGSAHFSKVLCCMEQYDHVCIMNCKLLVIFYV